MNAVDRAILWAGSRLSVARDAFSKKAPRYIQWEADNLQKFDLDQYLRGEYSNKDLQKFSNSIPWIYSNIMRISNEVVSSDLLVVDPITDEKKKDHEFIKLWRDPNPFFGPSATVEYALRAMLSDEWGGFWFLFPYDDNPAEIAEIWPVPVNRLRPIKDGNEFVEWYAYYPNGAPLSGQHASEKPLMIPASHICRFFVPDPDDLWKNLTPLEALRRGINVYENIATSQESLFGAGGGVPLSIVLLDKYMSEPDFIAARTQIMEDWQSKKRIAVARGGGLEVKNVGISNRDLEVVESLKLNRDEIDSVYMTRPWRGEGFTSGETLRQIDREIKSAVIYPILKRMGEQITIQVIIPFYDDGCVARFTDVRKQDKALQIQENAVNWRAMTFNEARQDINQSPYQLPDWIVERVGVEGVDIGNLPFQWVISPSTMMALLGMQPGQQEEVGAEEELTPQSGDEPPIGNVDDQIHPEAETNLELRDRARADRADINVDLSETLRAMTPIQQEAIRAELKRFRKVLVRRMDDGQLPKEIEFDTEIIPVWMMDRLRGQINPLDSAEQEQVKSLIGELL